MASGSGKGLILAAVGLGGVVLLARAASANAKPSVQKTYVDTMLNKATAKATAKGGKIDAAKNVAKKGTAEVQSAVNAINNLLK